MSHSKSYWTKRRKIRANVEKHLQSIISYAASKNLNSEAILDNNDDDDVVMSTEHQHSSPRPFVPSDIHREIASTYGHEVLDRMYGQILTILEEIRTEQRQVTAELKKALAKMASGNDTDSEELELPEDMVLPVPSMDALLTLEERLGEQSREKALVSRLGMIGDTPQTVRRILKDVLSHTVSLQLNWTGKGGKTAFAGLRLKDVLSKAVKRNPVTAEATEHEIEKAAKGWLRGATDRNGGWNKRRKLLE